MDSGCPYRQAVSVQSNNFDPATYGDHRNNLEQVHVVGGLAPGQWRIIIRTDPREHSSGHRRRLGHISKQGDTHQRMPLPHGARPCLAAAKR